MSESTHAPRANHSPRTLTIDIGGTGLKASVLDGNGRMVVKHVRIKTPHPCVPSTLLKALSVLIKPLPNFDRVSVGFPGVVQAGCVVTAPHFGNRHWQNFALAKTMAERFRKPVRLLNDAEVQGFGLIYGEGLELVLTLGTGAGTALFRDGVLMPHLELSQHPIKGKKTYDDYIGDEALKRKGLKKWNRRVHKAIKILHTLLNYDVLHVGGGNGIKIIDPPDGVLIGSNDAGITGGIKLWQLNGTELEAGDTQFSRPTPHNGT